MAASTSLYQTHELGFRTQYAELKERVRAAGQLLRGTPGALYKRSGTGHDYWYRVYYPFPGKQAEDFVGAAEDQETYHSMASRIAFAEWESKQVSNLRKLGFQVADKGVAGVLVELYNQKLFESGLVVVGTLAYMSWLNELGAVAVAARTQDIDLARRRQLKVAAPLSFLESIRASQLPFTAVPGIPSRAPSTSLKLPGKEGLRVDVLAPGKVLGAVIELPELQWSAQAIPHYDYMLEDSRSAAMLAGGHAVPVRLPQAERMIWHKLYVVADKSRSRDKAAKDLRQAATLSAVLVEQEGVDLKDSFAEVPRAMRSPIKSILGRAAELLAEHPQVGEAIQSLI